MIRDEFKFRRLNEAGMKKAEALALCFSDLLNNIEDICGKDGRFNALVKTKLEEAVFFARRALSGRPENQVGWIEASEESEEPDVEKADE